MSLIRGRRVIIVKAIEVGIKIKIKHSLNFMVYITCPQTEKIRQILARFVQSVSGRCLRQAYQGIFLPPWNVLGKKLLR